MWLHLTYTAHNLARNPLRTLLTCAAVSLPITIFVLTGGVLDGINRFLDNSVRQLRLAVTQKSSIVNPLPMGHRAKIEALDPTRRHLLSVCGLRWIGGTIANDPRPLSVLAADCDTFPATFPEHLRTAAEHDAWVRERTAIVVGRATAKQFGWNIGDRITIRPSVPPYGEMEFKVVSITAPDVADAITCFCREDYLEEVIKEGGWLPGLVSMFLVKCATKEDLETYRHAIDNFFAHSSDETFTQDEKAFMNQFITQQFNLPRNLSILAVITIFVAVLAAMNTMSMNFRDRVSEFATLRAIGFGRRVVFSVIQAESLFVCVLGGLIGALGPYIAFTYTPLRSWTVPVIQTLEIRPLVCGYALAIAAGIGAAAAIWPSLLAARLRVAAAFRLLE
jgi:putative ABC transport system permease protein